MVDRATDRENGILEVLSDVSPRIGNRDILVFPILSPSHDPAPAPASLLPPARTPSSPEIKTTPG